MIKRVTRLTFLHYWYTLEIHAAIDFSVYWTSQTEYQMNGTYDHKHFVINIWANGGSLLIHKDNKRILEVYC